MPDNNPNIFLSYKMGKAEEGKADIAELFAQQLSNYSAGRINVYYAGAFERGIDWRDEIIQTIKKCDIFILLFTGADQQWEFCLLEAGLFRAMHPDGHLVVMHDEDTPVPIALADLNAVAVTAENIKKFLKPIFYEEPWKINPKLTSDGLTGIAEDLVLIFHSEAPKVTNFDLVPSFTLEMAASPTSRSQLSAGRLPDKTTLKGTQGWQVLFDKGTASSTFTWDELTQWPVKDYYDLKFSRMVSTALNKDPPGGCFIRPSMQGQSSTLYRVALRRYEEYANEKGWRFYFTAAPIDIPIFGIGDTAENDETTNYHLLNVCWYTRRKLILVLYEDAIGKASSAATKSKEKDNLVAEIRDEIANINIQSFIRRIYQPASLEGLLPIKDVQADQLEWIRNTSIIDAYKTEADFGKVIEALGVMKAMNDKYYAASAACFSAAVAKQVNAEESARPNTSKL